MNWRDHIHSDPDVLGGKPVVRGTRISVELILEYFADGSTLEDVLAAYDHLTAEDVRAALAFAQEMIAEEQAVARKRAA
jgi:uncharacterized protein (DUF433 family)